MEEGKKKRRGRKLKSGLAVQQRETLLLDSWFILVVMLQFGKILSTEKLKQNREVETSGILSNSFVF